MIKQEDVDAAVKALVAVVKDPTQLAHDRIRAAEFLLDLATRTIDLPNLQ
jgi:hypothetical protein